MAQVGDILSKSVLDDSVREHRESRPPFSRTTPTAADARHVARATSAAARTRLRAGAPDGRSRSAFARSSTERGASLRISPREIATQPAVGVRPGRARWKKIALPRPLMRRESCGRARSKCRRAHPPATCGLCSRARADERGDCSAGSMGPRTSLRREEAGAAATPPV